MIAISVRQTQPLADDEWCNDGEPDEEIVSTLPSCPASAGIRNIQINQLNIHPLLISLVTQLYLFLCKVCKVTEVLWFRRWSEEWQFITWQVKLSPLSGVCSSWDKPRWCRPRRPGRWWCTSRPSPWQRRYSCNTFRGCNKRSIILIVICTVWPVVLPLGEGAGAAELGAGLPLPGHDCACAGPHEHEGPYQVPGGLEQL